MVPMFTLANVLSTNSFYQSLSHGEDSWVDEMTCFLPEITSNFTLPQLITIMAICFSDDAFMCKPEISEMLFS